MVFKWIPGDTLRPNRYIDWEAQVAKASNGKAEEAWAPVAIRVRETVAYIDNVTQLLGDTSPENGRFKMTVLERRRLAKQKLDIEDHGRMPSDPEKEFSIYMPESLIYERGEYNTKHNFEILSAGPPIEGLKFNVQDPAAGERREPAAGGRREKELAATVAIGIIDDGIAFAHEQFRNGAEPRVRSIWLQDIERREGFNVAFGTRLVQSEIEELLRTYESDEASIYQRVETMGRGADASRTPQTTRPRLSHGTHVMDLAAGNRAGSDNDVPIFAVQLPSEVTLDTSGTKMGSYVLQGLRFIMDELDSLDIQGADGDAAAPPTRIPLVVNFSYGTFAGPKDGLGDLEREIDRMIEQRAALGGKTFVVLPAGNGRESRCNASMKLAPRTNKELTWTLLPDDRTQSYLEIWLPEGEYDPKVCPLNITLTPPGAAPQPLKMPTDGTLLRLEKGDSLIGGLYYDIVKPSGASQRARVFIALNPTGPPIDRKARADVEVPLAPAGRWSLVVENGTETDMSVNLYIQRDDTPVGFRNHGRQSYLEHPQAYERNPDGGDYDLLSPSCPITELGTLTAIGHGQHPLVVGAVDGGNGLMEAADYSSSGPTISGRPGPDLSAIADDSGVHRGTIAAGTFSGSQVVMGGTSVAAPLATRQIAEVIAENAGQIAGLPLKEARDAIVAALDSKSVSSANVEQVGKFVLRKPRQTHPARRISQTTDVA